MIVNVQDIRYCLDKAVEITGQYKAYVLDGDNPRKSIDDLLWICEQYQNHKIIHAVLTGIQAENSSIRGFYMKVDGGCEIYLLDGMNFCWNRFVLCKELFHLLLDDEKYRNLSIYNHLEEVSTSFPQPDSRPNKSAVSELMAEISAMEFLYPYEKRVMDRAGGPPLKYREIAEYYKVPQYYVEKYLSDAWMEYLGAFQQK